MIESIATTTFDRELEHAISAVPFITERNLDVSACRGKITIRGSVESFYEKQMAQETLRSVAGVEKINNRIVVV